MSLILDALRKMEQERKARQGAAQDLRPEVLRYRSQMKQKQGKLPVIVCLFLVAVAVGAASFYIGKRDAGKFAMQHPSIEESGAPGGPTAPPEAVPPVEGAGAIPSPQPPVAAPYVAPYIAPPLPQPRASAPVNPDPFAASSSNGRSANAVRNFTGVTRTPGPDGAATAVRQNRSTATLQQAEQAGAPLPAQEARLRNRSAAEVQQAAPADITISGIAFQDERRLRRAVINGILVGEGEEVAGARVVEIKEHKVRMSRGGKLFDVPFGSGTSGM